MPLCSAVMVCLHLHSGKRCDSPLSRIVGLDCVQEGLLQRHWPTWTLAPLSTFLISLTMRLARSFSKSPLGRAKAAATSGPRPYEL